MSTLFHLSKFDGKPEKCIEMYYTDISSDGKEMYDMKDVQNAV